MSGPRGSRAPEVGGLGRKVIAPAFEQDEYEPVPGRPYWWKHRETGYLKYAPPTPSLFPDAGYEFDYFTP